VNERVMVVLRECKMERRKLLRTTTNCSKFNVTRPRGVRVDKHIIDVRRGHLAARSLMGIFLGKKYQNSVLVKSKWQIRVMDSLFSVGQLYKDKLR